MSQDPLQNLSPTGDRSLSLDEEIAMALSLEYNVAGGDTLPQEFADSKQVVHLDSGDMILLDNNENSSGSPFLMPMTADDSNVTSRENRIELKHSLTEQEYCLVDGEVRIVCDIPPEEAVTTQMLTRFNHLSPDEQQQATTSSGTLPMSWSGVQNSDAFIEHGIVNPDYKCYLISTIQLLSHVPAFAALVSSHHLGCDPETCLLCEWKLLQFQGIEAVGKLDNIIKVLKPTWPVVGTRSSEDVEECIYTIFNHISFNFGWAYEQNPIQDIFGFKIRGERKCSNCQASTQTPDETDVIFKLMLKHNHVHLQAVIDNFFAPTLLHGYKCERCGLAQVQQTMYFVKTPDVLLITDSNQVLDNGSPPIHACAKLNIGKHAAIDNNKFGMYEFCGFVCHYSANVNQGHYFAVTKRFEKKRHWVVMNDDEIFPCPSNPFCTPYMMLYRRVIHCDTDHPPQQPEVWEDVDIEME